MIFLCLSECLFLFRHQSVFKSPIGQFGIVAIVLISACEFRTIKLKNIIINFIF
jgi:hypothetical protein